jgi:tetratricopeptide (TPR) repeat protein
MNRLLNVFAAVLAATVLTAQAPPAPVRVPIPPVPVPAAPMAPVPQPVQPLPPPAAALAPEEIAAAIKACDGGPAIHAAYQLSQCMAIVRATSGVTPAQKQRARLKRGQAFFAMGHVEKSEADLTAALAGDKRILAAWRDRARARFYLKNYKAAIADADEALKLNANDAQAFYHRANSQYELREYAKALADYDAAIKADPKFAHAYADRGITQLRRENFDAAIKDIETAIKLERKPIPWAQAQLDEAKAAKAALSQRQTRSLQPPAATGSGGASVLSTNPSASAGVELDPAPLLKTRVALVIGNAAYKAVSTLPNAARDATDIGKAFAAAGYQVFGYPKVNMTRSEMFEAIKAFQAAAAKSDSAVVWYAGHGQEFDMGGTKMANWLIPIDFPSDGDVLEHGVPLSRLMTAASTARTLRVVVVDACRNSNLPTGSRGSRGFAVEERSDMMIVYSTRAGRTADDGPKGSRNSPFAAAFLETLNAHGKVDVRQFFGGVARGTVARTRNLNPPQEPEMIVRIQTIATLALKP